MGFGSILGGAAGFVLSGGNPAGAALGSQLGGAIDGNNAARKATKQQAAAVKTANAGLDTAWQYNQGINAPSLQARNQALAQMQKLLGVPATGPTSAQVMADPGYQFGLQQGQQALDRRAAARGMLNSGAALQAAARYGNDYGTTKYNDAFNRMRTLQNDRFGQLGALGQFGQVGVNNLDQGSMQTAVYKGNNALGLGNAQAAATLGNNAQQRDTMNQLGGWFLKGANPSNLFGGGGGSGSPSNDEIAKNILFMGP